MHKRIFLTIVAFLLPSLAYASVYGGTNLGYTGYPSHTCFKPSKPIKPMSFSSQWDVDSYNSQVDHYNLQIQQYLRCIEEYVDSANNDINRIREKAQDAINEASY